MITFLYLLVAFLLVFLNGFFVLAEFAAVKLRGSRVEEIVDKGQPQAKLLEHIHEHLDGYLSVCQLGITFASIGLGFVGEPAIARIIEPLLARFTDSEVAWSHAVALAIAYFLVSFLHILLGEIIPKSIAIRVPEKSALLTARSLRFFYAAFYFPLFAINFFANGVLRLIGLPITVKDTSHTEKELRIILGQHQEQGQMSFRRLLYFENVFDLGALRAKNIRKPKNVVKVVKTDLPWLENYQMIREARFSRYPVISPGVAKPIGIFHVKDLFLHGEGPHGPVEIQNFLRQYVEASEDARVEDILALLQKQRLHVALVFDGRGRWTGLLTLEDIAEQILGAIEDEFERDTTVYISDTISEQRILLGIEAKDLREAVVMALSRLPKKEIPIPPHILLKGILDREQLASTYVGRGLAIPHARLKEVNRPYLIFVRSDHGVATEGSDQKVHLLFILVTPDAQPHLQVRFLSRLFRMMESEFLEQRLREAETPREILDALQAGETAAIT